ncbi:MAG: class I SAM-dependent methyltransferase, partial [Promethearchaeota archaeon]
MSRKKEESSIRRNRTHDIDTLFKLFQHKPRRLLDIGFGNCAIAEYYSSLGIEVSGVEVSKKIYQKAINRNIPNLKLYLYDGIHLPFDNFSFDTIILNDILEHISYENIEMLIPEILRVLEPCGLIYISVMNRWQILEPHKLIPFLTWLPKPFWHPICIKLTGTNYLNYWPYTRKRAERLFNKF